MLYQGTTPGALSHSGMTPRPQASVRGGDSAASSVAATPLRDGLAINTPGNLSYAALSATSKLCQPKAATGHSAAVARSMRPAWR